MDHSLRLPSRTTSLVKAVALYLVAIVLFQSVAAAFALGAGPAHRHRAAPTSVASVLFSHHEQAHASGQRHHHAVGDASVGLDATEQEAADAARLALSAALALLALQTPKTTSLSLAHILIAPPNWSWQTASTLPLYRPPVQS